jgi:ATP synthase (C/AC39) subunit
VIAAFRLAFGNARLRARKSRLRTASAARLLGSVPGVAAFADALGLPAAHEQVELDRVLFDRLLDDYRRILDDYSAARPLLHALLARHEVENVKLGWRALARGLPPSRWIRLWRRFGALETLSLETFRDASSLAEAVRRATSTPWGRIVRETLEAHEHDPAAAELALDRFAFARVAEEAERLPRRETIARRLALSLVYERDLDAFRRATAFSGLSPELAGAVTVRLSRDLPEEALAALAGWTEGLLPFDLRLPAGIVPRSRAIPGWDALRTTIRRERVAACRRAFAGPPFRLAPAIAFLLLREAETRALTALASVLPSSPGRGVGGEEGDHATAPPSALDRVFAASLLGD